MDGREFVPPSHLSHRGAGRMNPPVGHSAVQHPGHFQATKYFSSPLPMATHSAGSALMANSSPSFMGSFLSSSLGSAAAAAHPAGASNSPQETTYRGPHGTGTSQIWFSHSHEGYPRFSASLASTFLPMSHLDHGNSNVLYGQHRFYESQKDNFYLRNLPAQPTLLSANHNFPSIARAAPGHPIGSCSRDRENGHLQKKDAERYLGSTDLNKEKINKGDLKERRIEEEGKERQKVVLPISLDGHCKEDLHQRGSCDNRTKHLNSCLMTSKVLNGDPCKQMLTSCTMGTGMPRQGSQSRCAKDIIRSDKTYPQHDPQQPYSECLERRQMLHHSVSYTVPSSLPSIPAPLNTSTGSFPCLQLHSNPDVVCSLQEKAGRDLKMGRPTFVPSVGYFTDKSRPFQVTPESCHVDREEGKDKSLELNSDIHLQGSYSNTFSHLKTENKGERRLEWQQNSATRIKNLEFLSSGGSEHAMQRGMEKGGYFEMPPSQDFPRPNHQDAHCVKPSQSCCTLDRSSKDPQTHSSQKVARIRHQQHRPTEMEQTGSVQDGKRKTIELNSLGYNVPPLPPWTDSSISINEERKNSYLDPFSTSLQQAALMTPGPSLNQEMQGPTDEVSAMKNLLKYSNQALIVGQRAPFVGLGNMKASCSQQEMKFHSSKCQPEQERMDCARSRENEISHGDGEVRQPPVGIAVAVARQKDTGSRQDPLFGAGSSRHSRNNMGPKGTQSRNTSRSQNFATGSGRSMNVIDLDSDDERNRLCDERLGISGRDILMQENKDLVEFARIHPSSGCPGDLTPHLMIASGSSLQASQLGGDPTSHSHPTHPHWLPRTRSPSIWMGGHSYSISHPALHQNLPPGFPTSMPSAMQPVFPLSQEPPAQLVILPPDPSPHTAPHPLADVMDQASLWPPMYPGRGPASHLQHPGQLPVYSRSQFLRQQELYALQQQRAAQALDLQRQNHLQRKPEDHQPEPEDTPENTIKSNSKTDTLNAFKSQTPPALLLPPPSAPAPSKLSPCCHSPAIRPPLSKCPTSRPLAPCTLPACPEASSVLVPSSPAVSPVPVQNAKGKEGDERRGEGQPPRDYPKSLEPDLPPRYKYPDVVQSYTSPSPHHVHSADPADTESMQKASAAAEPEQSRTFTPTKKPCDTSLSSDSLELSQKLSNLDETDLNEICVQVPQRSQELECGKAAVATDRCMDKTKENKDNAEKVQPVHEEAEREKELEDDGDFIGDFIDTSSEQLLNISNGSPAASLTTEETNIEASGEVAASLVDICDQESRDPEGGEDNPLSISQHASPAPFIHHDSLYTLDTLIAASISIGELPSLQDEKNICCPNSSPPLSNSGINGIALLSELADLALQEQPKYTTKTNEDESVVSDLQVFATIATAWSLAEAAILDGAASGCPVPYCLNIAPRVRLSRRTYTWTPKTKMVCPLKAAIDHLDTQEVDKRMKLVEIQRRYKEKQRELVKLQRRHDHEKEESSRSPVRRGPGRPRKRPHCRALSSHRSNESKKAKSLNKSLNLLCTELRTDGEPTKKIKFSEECYSDREHPSAVKLHCKKTVSPKNKLSSKLAQKVSKLQSKVLGSAGSAFCNKDVLLASKIQKKLPHHKGAGLMVKQGLERKGQERLQPVNSIEDPEEGGVNEEDSESEEEQDVPGVVIHDASLALHTAVTPPLVGPSPSSVVKMEANQKAKKKIERQGLLGYYCSITSPESEVKIRKHSAKLDSQTLHMKPLKKKSLSHASKPKGSLQQCIASGTLSHTPNKSLFGSPALSLKKDKKNKDLQRKNGVLSLSLTSRGPKSLLKHGRVKSKQERGRAVSRLLQSFAVEDDFQFDDNSSFSEGDDNVSPAGGKSKDRTHVCSLSKMDLREGLKVLIPKEDNLLYAASIRSLQPPDIYSVVIEGERGNRPRIYSQEQLLQEAVVDIRPQSTRCLPHGTRVCAYWSQKSRCLYPGNVVRGSSSDEGESDSVTVAFDDGDRGKITLNNIRLLPPDYTIQCTEPSPALLLSAESRRAKRVASNPTASIEPAQNLNSESRETEPSKNINKKMSNKEKTDVFNSGANTPLPVTNFLGRSSNVGLLNWASQGKRKGGARTGAGLHESFQQPGCVKKQKSREQPHVFGNGFGAGSFSSLANSYLPFGGSANPGLTLGQKPMRAKKGERSEEEDKRKGSKRKAGNEFLVKLDHEGVMSPKTKNGKALLLCDKDFGLRIGQSYTTQTDLGKDKKREPPLHEHLPMSLALRKYSGQAEFGLNCDSDCPSSYSDQDEEENEGDLPARVPSKFLAGLTVSSSSSGSSSTSSSGSLSSSSISSTDNEDLSESSDEGDSSLLLQPCLTHPVPALLAQHPEDGGSSSRGCFVSGQKAKQRRKGTSSSFSKTKEPCPKQQRLPSVENRPKISAFLPARQLWKWSGEPTQRRGMKGKARKLFYKAIVRGKETLHVGDCAVFLSAGRPNLPYIGRIESMWESWGGNMVVKVKWFYHPEETKLGKRHSDGKNALYQSSHEDENDIQTISHKCQVVSRQQYDKLSHNKRYLDRQNLYYLAGTYDPGTGRLVTADGVPVLC
ncbi:BAH and coiled-coil domain-containing protein 1 isoform X2 [Xenopus laevis]|uniref:BAH and coiled-coil domain-containing protein 1 isoform X2 n=1 Tax=Xenopus laevis TaxID=8355 RepID=A0A8J1LZK4_XENLA|nr:BAH and coiled-coil domain-containing protein 1 isoform X2 [Xenopus laevis]